MLDITEVGHYGGWSLTKLAVTNLFYRTEFFTPPPCLTPVLVGATIRQYPKSPARWLTPATRPTPCRTAGLLSAPTVYVQTARAWMLGYDMNSPSVLPGGAR